MKPNILDPRWKYTPSGHTDIRKTFARIRKQLAEQQAANDRKVQPLKRSTQGER